MWLVSHKQDRDGARLADGHYSRRTPGSPQFLPPGETLVLVTPTREAVWGWWRPHPAAVARGQTRSFHKLEGWTCAIFRNTDASSSSMELVLAAERELAEAERAGRTAAPCGDDGMLTWVWPAKIRHRGTGQISTNPGWCYQLAGWTRDRWSAPSVGKSRRKRLLKKPLELAGVAACAWMPDRVRDDGWSWRDWHRGSRA